MPTTPRNPSRTRIATVRFEPSEYERLQSAADERGISVSELIRRMSLGRVLPAQRPPLIESECVVELRRIGVNLNQTTHLFNRWHAVAAEEKKATWTKYNATVRELQTQLDAIARALK